MTFKKRLMLFGFLTALFTAIGLLSLVTIVTIIGLFHEQITAVKMALLAALAAMPSAFFAGWLTRERL